LEIIAMPKLLFRLNGVPDDEAHDIRELLTTHRIDFYETDAGRWGISVAGVWLRDEEQLDTAKQLIDHYQAERTQRVRAEYDNLRSEGRHETLMARFLGDPVRFLVYAAIILVILYFSLAPFLREWR
jgi:hypothetical protein